MSDWPAIYIRIYNLAMRFDEIGYWSEVKLAIIKEYAAAYSRILSKKGFHHIYRDFSEFSGYGHES
jgi:hypothetical protein